MITAVTKPAEVLQRAAILNAARREQQYLISCEALERLTTKRGKLTEAFEQLIAVRSREDDMNVQRLDNELCHLERLLKFYDCEIDVLTRMVERHQPH